MTNQNQLQAQQGSRSISYEANGEEITLSPNIVRNYLVRGNKDVTDQEVVMFLNLCKYQKLNPFLNEAYIVKFGNEAQIVVGKEAFMKRAEENPSYDGFKAGVIVLSNQTQEISQREGTFVLDGHEKLVGGWAKVYRKDRSQPYQQTVSMKEYNKNQSTWKQIPATMIRKTALVQALREAFPQDLGAMYTEEEVQTSPVDVTPQQEVEANQATEMLSFEEPEAKPIQKAEPAETIIEQKATPEKDPFEEPEQLSLEDQIQESMKATHEKAMTKDSEVPF